MSLLLSYRYSGICLTSAEMLESSRSTRQVCEEVKINAIDDSLLSQRTANIFHYYFIRRT